jgi:hypothetical protein
MFQRLARSTLTRMRLSAWRPSRVGDEHALGAWPEDLDNRFCRSGHSAWSAPPDEPCHDKRPDRDQEARRRASYAVNKIADRGPEQRTKHDG